MLRVFAGLAVARFFILLSRSARITGDRCVRPQAQQQRAAAGRARLAKYRAEDGADPPTITVGICNQLAGEVTPLSLSEFEGAVIDS